ncbi:hypothetical protein NX059_011235 [Plenodomus lindquistii]|nr:hypothetical protein NX059_011235 [Plenodomus lindquistii]
MDSKPTPLIRATINYSTDINGTEGENHTRTFESSPQHSVLFMMFLVVLSWYWMTRALANQRMSEAKHARQQAVAWRRAWRIRYSEPHQAGVEDTKEKSLFFGLVMQTLKSANKNHPFTPESFQTVQKCSDDEARSAAIYGLLERGIIPLAIHDGGLETTQIGPASWSIMFPFYRWPRFRQAKSRAYMEIAFPCDEENGKKLIAALVNKREDLMVSISLKDQGASKSSEKYGRADRKSWWPSQKVWRPLIMGAEGPVEALLPFMPDKLIEMHRRIQPLRDYLNGLEWKAPGHADALMGAKVPFLFKRRVLSVRLESKTWGGNQLEQFVYECVEAEKRILKWRKIARSTCKALEECGVDFTDS